MSDANATLAAISTWIARRVLYLAGTEGPQAPDALVRRLGTDLTSMAVVLDELQRVGLILVTNDEITASSAVVVTIRETDFVLEITMGQTSVVRVTEPIDI